ncbi:MAG: short chain dehydrogenase [Legionellales bacterium]|nr:short chain dehydrogenase [Legionellales bacterium]|tara:strand:+ start:236 stop:1036 length:801 start_codon:yes stop_codon:yes gene_type:complete
MLLKGKTVLVSGGIRGLGLDVVRMLSKNLANIVIIGKSVHPHPDMPDTIYSAAEEAEELGAVALPVQADIRFDDQIQKALLEALGTFGQLDACVNLASVCIKTKIQDTPMSTYDLVSQINVRGAYLLSRFASEYLSESKNPHIINLSPPTDLCRKTAFSVSPVYAMSKMEQSNMSLAMSHAFADKKIAVNSLWPKKKLHGAEEAFLGDPDSTDIYSSDIYARAVVALLTQNSSTVTGNLFYDDDFLKSVGETADYETSRYEPVTEG